MQLDLRVVNIQNIMFRKEGFVHWNVSSESGINGLGMYCLHYHRPVQSFLIVLCKQRAKPFQVTHSLDLFILLVHT